MHDTENGEMRYRFFIELTLKYFALIRETFAPMKQNDLDRTFEFLLALCDVVENDRPIDEFDAIYQLFLKYRVASTESDKENILEMLRIIAPPNLNTEQNKTLMERFADSFRKLNSNNKGE